MLVSSTGRRFSIYSQHRFPGLECYSQLIFPSTIHHWMSHFNLYYVALNLPVLKFSSDHSTNSVLDLSCLGQHKDCGEVHILLIPGCFGVREVLMYSG